MKELNRLLLIKSEEKEIQEVHTATVRQQEQEEAESLCGEHNQPIRLFCAECLTYLYCGSCSHPHPLTPYHNVESCLCQNAGALESLCCSLRMSHSLSLSELQELQEFSARALTSKTNIFRRIRKFVDELENAVDLQLNRVLAQNRGRLIGYEKSLRRVLEGDQQGLLSRVLHRQVQDFDLQRRDWEHQSEDILEKMRAFVHGLKSPLAKEVTIQLNTTERKAEDLSSTARTPLEIARPSSTSRMSKLNSSATLEKRILESILDSQRRDKKKENSNFLKTLNLLGKEKLTIEPKRIKFFDR